MLFFRPLYLGSPSTCVVNQVATSIKTQKLQDTELALERRKVYLGFWLLRVHPMVMGCIAGRQSILDWWKR